MKPREKAALRQNLQKYPFINDLFTPIHPAEELHKKDQTYAKNLLSRIDRENKFGTTIDSRLFCLPQSCEGYKVIIPGNPRLFIFLIHQRKHFIGYMDLGPCGGINFEKIHTDFSKVDIPHEERMRAEKLIESSKKSSAYLSVQDTAIRLSKQKSIHLLHNGSCSILAVYRNGNKDKWIPSKRGIIGYLTL